MACTLSASGLIPLNRAAVRTTSARRQSVCVKVNRTQRESRFVFFFFFSLSGFSPSKMFSPRDEESCAPPRGRKSLRERERERSSSRRRTARCKKNRALFLFSDAFRSSLLRKKKEKKRKREREMQNLPLHLLEKDRSLSLSFFDFCALFFALFFLFLCLLSLFYVVGKRERVLLGVDCFDLRTKER